MRITRFHRLMALALMAVLLLGSVGALPTEAETVSELEAKLERLEEQEKELKKDLSAASTDLSASKERKALLDNQIANVTQQIELLAEQLDAVNDEIAEKEAEIAAAEVEIAEKEAAIQSTHDLLGQRLRTIAKTGNLSGVQRLLNTDNYTEYLLKSKAAECIARRDQETMDKLEAALEEIHLQKEALEKEQQAIEAQKTELEALKKQSDKKKRELDTLCAAAQSEVRNLQNTVTSYNDQLAETQRKIAQADAAIEELIKQSQVTGKYDQNMMYWPVPTIRNISSYFGDRWGGVHRGIDVSEGPIPCYGENIVAAADGTVIASNYTSTYGTGWSYGYGYCVIVDHGLDKKGRRITTMYAHMSKNNSRVGQKVTGGKTVLGQIGRTGDVTGPHLHFEVRVDGVRVDPYNTYVNPKVN